MSEHLFLEKGEGRTALYIGGDLQFDSTDEAIYHGALAALPAALAAARRGSIEAAILGGGDGLALRELLRRPELSRAELVERDPAVLALGRGELSALNADAFKDARATVTLADARDALARGPTGALDLLIWDLTYPCDSASAELLSLSSFQAARRLLRDDGIIALNAVSPERAPQAFNCLGATLAEAGLHPRGLSAEIPSFAREGYGRWGFFLGSPRPISEEELARAGLPPGCSAELSAALAALPVSLNRVDELLYYVANAEPIAWAAPFVPWTPALAAGPGPRLSAGEGFARWARSSGKRSLEELLLCLPLARRDQTRRALLEWSRQAETLFRETDLKAFCDATLKRAAGLPRAWVRELEAMSERLKLGRPELREMLEQAYRVFAVFLLILLTVNLFFPDNLYAKGFSSHYWGGRSSGSSSSPSWNWGRRSRAGDYDAPSPWEYSRTRYRPYRRRYYYGGYGYGYGRGVQRAPLYDSRGQQQPSLRMMFSDPKGGAKPLDGMLALSAEQQLLENGTVGCQLGLEGFQCLIEPDRVRYLDASGADVIAAVPPAEYLGATGRLLREQRPLLANALKEHRRWLDWTGWAARAGLTDDTKELAQLQTIDATLALAEKNWAPAAAPALPAGVPDERWATLAPGIWLEPANAEHPTAPLILWAEPGRVLRRRGVLPPLDLREEDKLMFRMLHKRFTAGKDEPLREIMSAWSQAHGQALGLKLPIPPRP